MSGAVNPAIAAKQLLGFFHAHFGELQSKVFLLRVEFQQYSALAHEAARRETHRDDAARYVRKELC